MSYLTTSAGTLKAQVIAALEGQGFAYDPLRTTFTQYLATALGDPTAFLHKSMTQMLSEIDAQYGGSLSHLRASIAQLLDDVAVNIGSGGGGVTIPVNTVLPTISGTAQVDATLTCSTGTWSGGGSISYAYQWKSAGSNVGSNQNTYVPVSGDIGNTITCTVTATNTAGSTPATSAATSAVTSGAEEDDDMTIIASGSLSNTSSLTLTIPDGYSRLRFELFGATITRSGSPNAEEINMQWSFDGSTFLGDTDNNDTYAALSHGQFIDTLTTESEDVTVALSAAVPNLGYACFVHGIDFTAADYSLDIFPGTNTMRPRMAMELQAHNMQASPPSLGWHKASYFLWPTATVTPPVARLAKVKIAPGTVFIGQSSVFGVGDWWLLGRP